VLTVQRPIQRVLNHIVVNLGLEGVRVDSEMAGTEESVNVAAQQKSLGDVVGSVLPERSYVCGLQRFGRARPDRTCGSASSAVALREHATVSASTSALQPQTRPGCPQLCRETTGGLAPTAAGESRRETGDAIVHRSSRAALSPPGCRIQSGANDIRVPPPGLEPGTCRINSVPNSRFVRFGLKRHPRTCSSTDESCWLVRGSVGQIPPCCGPASPKRPRGHRL
jgi:hypothetical protein